VTPEIEVRPITMWPEGWPSAKAGVPSPFRVKAYEETLEVLRRELAHLDARAAHLQADITATDLRRDGMLRARAQVGYRGVILTVDARELGVLTYPCDTFAGRWHGDPPDWQINLRAIAFGLEALRKVERYGIAERGQQYAGFGALPPGRPMGAAMTLEDAARLVADAGNFVNDVSTEEAAMAMLAGDETYIRAAYRTASNSHHPDVGGDPETFRQLTAARDLLLEHAR
jgi:hypothetical protein